MRFFEHQRHAKKATNRMLWLFALSVVVVSVSVGILVSLIVVLLGSWINVTQHSMGAIIMRVSLVVAGVVFVSVCVSSLIKVYELRSGGHAVAKSAGGTFVPATTADPALRQLRNVVEEMAVSSRVPMPAVYILENEPSINAFAAGFDAKSAAIGVTRGAVDHLTRSELQAVIGHEFSHILNGDMRLNIHMMGVIHGLFVLTVFGHHWLRHVSGRTKEQNALALVGLVLIALGWVGAFSGRLIKSYVSRQREFLADASSVQYTRNAQAMSAALKKIAACPHGSKINHVSAREEMSHMFFGASFSKSSWWDTHPPVEERIRRIDPSFKPFHIEKVKKQWLMSEQRFVEEKDNHSVNDEAPTK